MTSKPQTFIAGERLDDLVAVMRQMPATRINDRRAQISFSLDDNSIAPWVRATERYAADLLVVDRRLTWRERIDQAAQRLADEVAAALSKDSQ